MTSDAATPLHRCTVCRLPDELRNELHAQLLGDRGDPEATPPRMPVLPMSPNAAEKWLESKGVALGYKSIYRHKKDHIVILPQAKVGVADLREARAASDPVLAAAAAQCFADTSRLDEAAEIMMDLFRHVGSAVKRRGTVNAAHRLGGGGAANVLSKEDPLTLTKAESDFFTGGMAALAQLEKVKLAVGIGKPDAKGKIGEALSAAAGVKGLVFGGTPPPIDGDTPDDDEAEEEVRRPGDQGVIDVEGVEVKEPVAGDATAPSPATSPVSPVSAPTLRAINGGMKIGLWEPPKAKRSMV